MAPLNFIPPDSTARFLHTTFTEFAFFKHHMDCESWQNIKIPGSQTWLMSSAIMTTATTSIKLLLSISFQMTDTWLPTSSCCAASMTSFKKKQDAGVCDLFCPVWKESEESKGRTSTWCKQRPPASATTAKEGKDKKENKKQKTWITTNDPWVPSKSKIVP